MTLACAGDTCYVGKRKERMKLAVNGSLMRGLKLNKNLIDAGASFVKEDKTKGVYRLFSINDVHPAMYKVKENGNEISVEIWEIDKEGLVSVLEKEPEGLCIGKIQLKDGSVLLGVLGEEVICKGMKEITEYGGWKEYLEAKC